MRIALCIVALVHASGVGAQWQELTSGTNSTLRSVFFVDSNTGYAVGGSGVIKTVDGGMNWIPILLGIELNDVFFMNSDSGFVAGGYHIHGTSNGGQGWTIVYTLPPPPPTNRFFSSVYFCNDSVGHVAGYAISIYGTNDFGTNWETKSISNPVAYYSLNSIHFPNNSTGYIAGAGSSISSNYGIVLKTMNGGDVWETILSPRLDHNPLISVGIIIKSVFFTDSLNGWIVGWPGSIFHTGDGGQTWNTTTTIFPSTLNDVFFLNRDKGFVADVNGVIYSTQDAGRTWQDENAPSAGREIHDIHCAGGACYAVGAGGMILKRAIGMGQGPPLDDGRAFSMFPNPANGTVIFVHDMGGPMRNARITVRDALGREVARLPLGGQDRTVWDTRGIPPGPYLVELHAEEGRIAVQRLVLSP